MDFYGIETGFAGQTDRIAVGTCHRSEFILPQSADEGGRVKVEVGAGSYGSLTANGLVRHVSAMSQLDADGRSFAVDGIGQLAESRYDFRTHPELAVERKAATGYGGVGYGSHADTSGGYGVVIIQQFFGRFVAGTHTLEGGRTDSPVPECQRTDFSGGEQNRFFHDNRGVRKYRESGICGCLRLLFRILRGSGSGWHKRAEPGWRRSRVRKSRRR